MVFRVQVTYLFPGAVAHPLAVVAHVGGQAGCPFPARAPGGALAVAGVHRGHIGKLGRDLNQRLTNHHGHRVEVAGVGLQAQALRFQGDGAAPGKGVEQGRWVAVRRQADQVASGLQHLLVGGALPLHQGFDKVEQPLAGGVVRGGVLAARQLPAGLHEFGRRVGIVHEGSKDDGAAGGQRSARPPQVQGAGVAVADGFLAGAGFVDGFEGEGDLDEFFAVGHMCTFSGIGFQVRRSETSWVNRSAWVQTRRTVSQASVIFKVIFS